MKCDQCDAKADVHLCEIDHGKKSEKHLCRCGAEQNFSSLKGHPINELLTKVVMQHYQKPSPEPSAGEGKQEPPNRPKDEP